jgi:hypothetical protein
MPGSDELGGLQHGADVAARASERLLQHKGDLRLHLGVDQLGGGHLAAVGHEVVVGHEAEHRRGDAHLLHLGKRGQAGLQARELAPARQLAAQQLGLHRVGVLEVHLRKVVGDLVGVAHLKLAGFEALGQRGNGVGVQGHGSGNDRVGRRGSTKAH